MIEKALVSGRARRLRPLRCVPIEAQAIAGTRRRLGARHIAALGADAIGGPRKAGRGDRRKGLARQAARRKPALGTGGVTEVAEGPLDQLVRKFTMHARPSGERVVRK